MAVRVEVVSADGVLTIPVNADEYNVRREHGMLLRHGIAVYGKSIIKQKYGSFTCYQQGLTVAEDFDYQDPA